MRNKKRTKITLTAHEQMLVGLEKVAKSKSENATAARSLVSWYLANHFWTEKQAAYAKSLIGNEDHLQGALRRAIKKYQLYAVSDGDQLKIGFSSNIGKRINSMQTGHPKILVCKWKFYVGRTTQEARSAEKLLHRACKKYKVRGEWFSMEAMPVIEAFKPKEASCNSAD